MAFPDDFNRADEYLEASANWTPSGIVNGAGVRSNSLAGLTSDTSGSLYLCPDQGSANHFSRAAFLASGLAGFLVIRSSSVSNYIGVRHNAGAWQLYKRVAGVYTNMANYTAALVPGDVCSIEADGVNNISVYANGVLRIGPIVETFNSSVTRQGIVPRALVINPWLDNFEAGVVGGGATLIPPSIPSAEAHGTPVLSLGPVSLLPAAIPSAESIGALTATPGAVGLAPSAIASAEAVGSSLVGVGPVSILVSGITTAEAIGLPALVGAGVILPSAIPSGESLGVLVVQPGAVSLSPSAISSAEVIGSHIVQLGSGGTVTLYPAGIASAEQAGAPALSAGSVALQPAAIASGEAIGAPAVASATVLLPTGIASVEAIGNAVVIKGAVILLPAGISSLEQIGVLTIIGGLSVIGYLEALVITRPALLGAVNTRPALTGEVRINVH